MKKLLILLLVAFPLFAFSNTPVFERQVIRLRCSAYNGHYVGHNIKYLPIHPLTATWDGETLTFDVLCEEDADVTILTLDGVQVGYYVISPEENSVTLSSDTPSSFVIHVTIGDAIYEGAVGM